MCKYVSTSSVTYAAYTAFTPTVCCNMGTGDMAMYSHGIMFTAWCVATWTEPLAVCTLHARPSAPTTD
jgi:hypothetical protein